MKVISSVALFFLLLVVVGATGGRDRQRARHESQRGIRFEDLRLGEPEEIYRSEAGRIEEWNPSNFPALCDAEVGARKVIIEKNSLAVPCYKDSPMIKVITRGSARVGVINPLADKLIDRTTVYRVTKGDAIALPQGVASWMYNDGDETTEVLEVADTTNSVECGRFQVFLLTGGKQQQQKSSVLHGFSRELLAHAFDVDEQTVDQILQENQEAIVRVDDRRKMERSFSGKDSRDRSSNNVFVDFVYRWSLAEPDVRVRDAGELRLLNSMKLPILKSLNMAGACMKMEAGALTAPGWIQNAHKVMYVERGNGRIQVSRENGEQALDENLDEGSLVIVPANFPSAKLAGNEGLHYFSIFTSHQPIESYIAGRNSVYKGMPGGVVSAGLQIDEETQKQLEEARKDEAYIFPARSESRRRQGVF